MSWNDQEGTFPGVVERGFSLTCGGRTVPGVYWTPEPGTQDLSQLVMLGHGGTTHKKADYIEQIAHSLCRRGVSAMAIDGPGHGDRMEADHPAGGYSSEFERFSSMWQSGGGTTGIVADWRASHDFIEAAEGERKAAYLGLSMGTMMGLPVCVSDKRISVAVLGLMGTWGPNGDDLREQAPEFEIPTRFLVQWDDEIVPRDRCLELFDALGSKKKTLHANPGSHGAVPTFEILSSLDYLVKELAK